MNQGPEFDFIIVGAGSAGCVLANRLSAKPDVKVLLLEAGGPEVGLYHRAPAAFYKLFKTKADWAFYTEPQAEMNARELFWPRGKVLGGSSAINAMIYMRGNPRDYDDWHVPGWNYREVLPYFKKLETHFLGPSEYHGNNGPLNVEQRRYTNPLSYAFVEAGVQAGLKRNDDFNGAEQEGVGLLHVTNKNGVRHSAAGAYLKPILSRPNLAVLTGARVHRVLMEKSRAVGVEYRHQGQVKRAQGSRVIISGGSVLSPQILMLSGIGPGEHLRQHGISVVQDLPVGQGLWDHLALPVIYRCKTGVSLDKAENLANLIQFLTRQNGPFVSNVAEAGAFVRVMPDAPAPDLQYHFGPAYFADHGFTRPVGNYFTLGPALIAPESRGFIELKSADPEANPRIQPRYLTERHDLEVLQRGVELAQEIASQKAFDPYRGEEAAPGRGKELRAYIRQYAQTLYHPAGTCAMGRVVDGGLKVYGTENLYVMDASVMPGVIRGNTNAPAIMVGERGADLLMGVERPMSNDERTPRNAGNPVL